MGLLQRIFNWKRDYEEAYEVEEWNEIVYDRDARITATSRVGVILPFSDL